MTVPKTGRAVVLGGGFAGLLAARVLSEHCDVVVVDRDPLDAPAIAARRGVPQGRHTHGLLCGGLRSMERLLPGITQDAEAAGAIPEVMECGPWHVAGRTLKLENTGLGGLLASRPLLESVVRQRVAELPRVTLGGGCAVTGLTATKGRVTGAVVTAAAGGDDEHVIPADLVVDATGRGSRMPSWLAAMGYAPPPEETIDIGLQYVTRRFRREPGQVSGALGEIVGTNPPWTRGGALLAQENDEWILTLTGYFGKRAPTDIHGFRGYAEEVGGVIAELAATAEPIGEASTFTYPTCTWRRYDKLRRMPAGLIAIGDAVASLNPVFGQGMSSAALQAEALGAVLRPTPSASRLPRLAAHAIAEVVRNPWTIGAGTDMRFPGMPRKPLRDRVLDRYLDRLLSAAEKDADVAYSFARVIALLDPAPALLRPRTVGRVAIPRRRGASRRPESLELAA